MRTRKQKDEKGGKAGEKKGMGEGQESLLHCDHKKKKKKKKTTKINGGGAGGPE